MTTISNNANRRGKDNEKDKKTNAVYRSVRSAWNQFCSWCADNGHPISQENKEHMTKVSSMLIRWYARFSNSHFQYNKHFLRKELHLRLYAREAKFSGDFHYGVLSVYAWRRSPIVHAKPRVRFVQHHITTTNFESAGRIGEFAKSDGREDGGADSEDEAER